MKKHLKASRRLLAVLCTLAMLLSLMPPQAFIVSAGNVDGDIPPVATLANVSTVNITDPPSTLTVGESVTLSASIDPSNAPQDVIWSSSDPEIATIDSATGALSAEKAGAVEITATATNDTPDDDTDDKKVSCTIQVNKKMLTITGITFDDKEYDASTDVSPALAKYTITDGILVTVNGLSFSTQDDSVADGKAVTIDGSPTLSSADAEKYDIELQSGLSPTINVKKKALQVVPPAALVYNGLKAGYASQPLTFSGFADGSDQEYTVTLVNPVSDTAVPAGTDVRVNIVYPADSRDQANYTWPDHLIVPTVNPHPVSFHIVPAGKAYDGTTDVLSIQENTCRGNPVGDDIGTLTNDLTADMLQFVTAGQIDQVSDSISAQLKGGQSVKVLLNGSESSNYVSQLDFGTASISINSYPEGSGFQVASPDYEGNGLRWYKGSTLSLTALNGYELAATESGPFASIAAILVDGEGKLTVIVKNAADGTLAKAEVENAALDDEAPTLTVTNTEMVFENNLVEYTITASDAGSGVAPDTVKYYIGVSGLDSSAIQESEWQSAVAVPGEDGTYTFTVVAPASPDVLSGYVYVRAQDNVGNERFQNSMRALVLEKNAPQLNLTCNTENDREAEHSIEITAWDAQAEGTDPYTYSGLVRITYSVETNDEIIVEETALYESPAPTSMDQIPDMREKAKTLVLGSGASYNGTYTLTVTAYDACGNSTEETMDLVFDSTAPVVTVTMDKATADDENGDYFYNQAGLVNGITVTFEEEALDISTGNYFAELTGPDGFSKRYGLTAAENGKGMINFPAADFVGAADGEYTLTVTASDEADNAATQLAVNSKGMNFDGITGTFQLDNTAPRLTAVTTADGNYYSDESALYYNQDFNVVFTVEEANLQTKTSTVTMTTEQSGVPAAVSDIAGTNGQYELSASVSSAENVEKAVYTAVLTVVDKAGNLLALDANLDPGQDGRNVVALDSDQGTATLTTILVLDTVAPTATLTYTALDNEHYYSEGNTTRAYYNTDLEASIFFEDANGLDLLKLNTVQYKDGAQVDLSAPEADGSKLYQVKAEDQNNGSYSFGAYGTDKAGNPLTLVEYQSTADDAQPISTTGLVDADKCVSAFEKIVDTVCPTYELSVTGPDPDRPEAIDGTTVYMNTEITASLTVSEENFDRGMVNIGLASVTGQVDYSTAEPQWTQVPLEKSDDSSNYTYEQTVNVDGAYRFEVAGQDKAGNPIVPSDVESQKSGWQATVQHGEGEYWTYKKVLDTKAPEITVVFNDTEEFYRAVLGEPTDGAVSNYYSVSLNKPYRSASSVQGILSKSDCSPVSITYSIESTTQPLSVTESAYDLAPVNIAIQGEQIYYLATLEAQDRAGNVSRMTAPASAIYLDVTAPSVDELKPTVQLVAHVSGDGRGEAGTDLYNSDVTVHASVIDPGEGISSSGLYKVYYKVLVNGADWTDKVSVTSANGNVDSTPGSLSYGTSGNGHDFAPGSSDQSLTYQDEIDFAFAAETFNYNDVKIFVWAEDNSGNLLSEAEAAHYYFGIDITSPTISVRYDNNDAQNEKYFKADRTATIVITERNFDPDNTKIDTQPQAHISGWSYAAGESANGDDDTWTCTVTYDQDGDYTFDVSTTDLAGHSAGEADYGDSVAPREFTIDKTRPVISITFDNNDVLNGKYYNRTRTATITIAEHNFSDAGATVTTTANIQEGTVSAPGISGWGSSGDSYVTQVAFNADGNYTMHVEFVDLAGNEAEPQDVSEFVVDTTAPTLEITGVEDRMAYNGEVAPAITYHDINYDSSSANVVIRGYMHPEGENLNGIRSEDAFGGSFVCSNIEPIKANDDVYTATGVVRDLAGNETEASIVFSVNRYGSTYILGEDTQALLDQYYTNEPQALHVTEINVSGLTENRVTTSLNGEVTTLEQGTDYSVQESVPGWHQFDYTINADNFTVDGAYDVTLYSVDEAGNASSNRSIKEDDAQTSDLPINFVVDMTAPVNVITGVENGAQYIDSQRTVTVNYSDNIAIRDLRLYIGDELVAEYDAEQLQSAGGTLSYEAQASNKWQQLRVVSTDMAGNTADEVSVRYLLTDNLLVQYYNNKPLFFGSLAVAAVVICLIIVFVKRRKDEEKHTSSSVA